MQNKEIVDQKIGQLAKLMKNPGGNEGAALQILHDLFQVTDEGRDLSPDNAESLNKTACLILSPELRAVLVKLRLDVYAFQFAALSLTDIVDVTDDLSNNAEILKGIHRFPPGAVNKLKRELLGQHQPNSLIKSSMVSSSPSPSETKKINKEQPEENSPQPSLENFLPVPTNKRKIIESPKEIANSNQHSTVTSGSGVKNTLKKGADSSNEKVNESTALPLKKRKLENETVLPSTSRPRQSSAPVDNVTLNIPIEQRLAVKLRDRCQLVENNSSGMQLYTLPLSKKPATRSSQAERYVFGSVFGRRRKAKVESKTILLMGATGSGKTTLINSMVNYILGVEFDDPFRFVLIKEEGTSSSPVDQAESQTSKVTAYELLWQDGFKIPFSLIIVDTPGYGDTKGLERDREITDSIEQFFKDKKGIQELDAVGFTVQSPLARLTATQKYIFESILAIFGNDVKDNISFLVTFTDGRKPPVLDAIKAANIAHKLDTHGQPRHHRFNNSGFFSSNQDEEDTIMNSTFWNSGIKSFDSFFNSLSTMKTRSLTLSTEVLEERKHIQVSVAGLTLNIHKQLNKMEALRKTKQVIENHKDQISTNHGLIFHIVETRGTKIDITDGKGVTNCSKCFVTCHFPCTSQITDDKRKCSAMNKDGFCTSCPLKCKWDLHLNQSYHWVYKDVKAKHRSDEILEKYEEAIQRKLSTEGVLHAMESELEQIKYDLQSNINSITVHLNRLDQIALRPDALTATEYIEFMILSETKEKKLGFRERIKSLDLLLENAKMVKKIRDGESVLPEEGAATDQSRSQFKVTIEPQSSRLKRTPIKRAQQLAPWVKNEFSPQQQLSSGKYRTRQQSRIHDEGGGWFSD